MSPLGLFEKVKSLWASWDLRSFLILSFSLQCVLIVTASMRKRTSKRTLLGIICLAYLLADWAAYYAIGLIPTGNEPDKYSDLHAFWAPFFLLHLGGPNTIAGFSIEDNELWQRSILHLVVQAGMSLYIIYRALPHNPLLGPTLLMFVAASTRYVERVMALYYASMDKFRQTVAKDDHAANDLRSLIKNRDNSTLNRRNISEVQMVKNSYILFQTYRGVFGSLPIKFDENLKQTKHYLLEVLDHNEAFEVMEIQMNLAYYIFYTKTWLIVEQKIGKFIHIVSLCCEAAALVLWVASDKRRYCPIDVYLTRTLVVGAVLIHVFSFFTIVFSDLLTPKLPELNWIDYLLKKAWSIRRHKWGRPFFSRWSETMPQFNLMYYILEGRHKRPELNPVIRLIESFIEPKKHGKRVVLREDVRIRIFKRIKYMALQATTQGIAESLCLESRSYIYEVYGLEELKGLQDILMYAGLVDALLVCHLATELLNKVDSRYKSRVTKHLSEYLICLLVDEPAMVGSEGVGIMFEDTCDHLKSIYESDDKVPSPSWSVNAKKELDEVKKERGDTTMRRHMLKYAHYIKGYFMGLPNKDTAAEIIEDIWVELLCHMAVKCRASAHLEQLSSGGELLTVVWLLMTYSGLTTNFEPDSTFLRSQISLGTIASPSSLPSSPIGWLN